jgi:hypothetical protein
MTTRRDFLKTSSLIAGAATVPTLLATESLGSISSVVTSPTKYTHFVYLQMHTSLKQGDVITELKRLESKEVYNQTIPRQMSEALGLTKPGYFIRPMEVSWFQGQDHSDYRRYTFLVFIRDQELLTQLGDKLKKSSFHDDLNKRGLAVMWGDAWYQISPATSEEIEADIRFYAGMFQFGLIGSGHYPYDGAYAKNYDLNPGLKTAIHLC